MLVTSFFYVKIIFGLKVFTNKKSKRNLRNEFKKKE